MLPPRLNGEPSVAGDVADGRPVPIAALWRIGMAIRMDFRNLHRPMVYSSHEVAEKQQAKSFQLRAATSLARLWLKQGECAEARDVLAPIYSWF